MKAYCTADVQSCEQLYACMGCKMNCGRCADYVESVLLQPEMPAPLAAEGHGVPA